MNPNRPDLSSEQIARLRELAELISWLFYEDRRLGLLERCERIEGRTRSGERAKLQRRESGWELTVGSHVTDLNDFGEVLSAIGSSKLVPEQVMVVPRFADLLFQGAVEQTQAGLASYMEYLSVRRKGRQEKVGELEPHEFFATVLGIPIGGPFEAALGMSSLDQSLRRSIAGAVLAISAAEAQANEWAPHVGGWLGNEDREPLVRKMKLLAKKASQSLDVGQEPFRTLQRCVDYRNDLVHPKPKERELKLSSPQEPGRDLSLWARETCLAVRRTLVLLAPMLGVVRPPYLAYCPPGDFEDDNTWSTAVIMTGLRDDPDFPKAAT